VNQVYWQARPAYDRLAESGKRLRAAQVAALKGRAADVRGATEAHRAALAQTVNEAVRLSVNAGLHPNPDELSRTLEAISLARELPEGAGRLTKTLQPAGFEALTGVTVQPGRTMRPEPLPVPKRREESPRDGSVHPKVDISRAIVAREKQRAAAERRKQRQIESAKKLVARAKAAEQRARHAWERAKRQSSDAEFKLLALQK
jgi:hypothetical protein